MSQLIGSKTSDRLKETKLDAEIEITLDFTKSYIYSNYSSIIIIIKLIYIIYIIFIILYQNQRLQRALQGLVSTI